MSRGKGPKADHTNVGAAVEQYDRTADFKSKSAVAETEPMEKRGATEGGSSSSAPANWWEVGNDNKWRAGAGGSAWNYGGSSSGSVTPRAPHTAGRRIGKGGRRTRSKSVYISHGVPLAW